MKIINLSQREEDWLEWRRQGITATDAAVLLDRSRYKTLWRLWAEKTGYAQEADLSMNPLVRRGIQNEDLARQVFEERHDDLLLPVCVESSTHPLMRSSLDGLTTDNEPVELKVPSTKVWEQVCSEGTNSDAYQLYLPQVQHQLLVTEAKQGWLVFFYEGQLKEFLVFPNTAMIQEILDAAQPFWEAVINRKAPAKDPERDFYIPEGTEAVRWIEAATEYQLFDAEIQEHAQRIQELKQKQAPAEAAMKSLMGEYFHADYCGVRLTKYRVKGKVDHSKLLADKGLDIPPEVIDGYREETKERWKIGLTGSMKPRDILDEGVLAPLEEIPEPVESMYF